MSYDHTRTKARFFFEHYLPRYLPRLLKRQWEIWRGVQGQLLDLYLFLTNQCNARCKHCFYIEELGYVPGEMRLADYERLAPSLPQLERIFLTGGEAILHPDCPEIALLLGRTTRAQRLTLITNGFLPDKIEAFCQRLLDSGQLAGVLDILVSLDGLEATHNEVRQNPQAWTKAHQTLHRLQTLKMQAPTSFDFGVITIITSRNWRELRPLHEHLKAEFPAVRQGFEFVRGTNFSLWGLAPEYRAEFNPPEDALPPPEVWDDILATLDAINRESGLANHSFQVTTHFTVKMLRTKRKLVDCVSAGQNVAVIYATGDVAVCEFSKPFANVKDFDMNFERLWNSEKAEAMRKATSRCWCTHGCYLSRNIEYSLAGHWAMLKNL